MKIIFYAAMLSLLTTMPAFAGDGDYSDFSRSIATLRDMTLSYCRKNANAVLNTTGIYGDFTDGRNFRWACGQGMEGQKLTRDYVFHYQRWAGQDGEADLMGTRKTFSHNGGAFSLVVGLATQISKPHNAPETSRTFADAVLFQKLGSQWQPLWRYVNPITKEWQRPPIAFTEQSGLTKEQARFIDDIWRYDVMWGTKKLINQLKDRRGTAFP